MKSNKYKFRISGYPNHSIGIAIYNQRSSRPTVIIGTIDDEDLFAVSHFKTPSYSARAYIADKCPVDGFGEIDSISGSIRFDDPGIQELIRKATRLSFDFHYRNMGRPKFDGGDVFEMILLVEYIKKHGKFYGNKERFLSRGTQGSQDQLQEGADLA